MRQEASRPNRIAKLIMPGGSAQVGFEKTKSLHSCLSEKLFKKLRPLQTEESIAVDAPNPSRPLEK